MKTSIISKSQKHVLTNGQSETSQFLVAIKKEKRKKKEGNGIEYIRKGRKSRNLHQNYLYALHES